MKPQYQFTFEQLTIGDAVDLIGASAQDKLGPFVRIADRYTTGGMLALPYAELKNAVDQFAKAFVAHLQQMNEANDPTPPDVVRLLRQALGGEASNE